MIRTIRAPKLADAIIISSLICKAMCSGRLTIVNEGFHMIRLYQRLQNQDPPTELDPGFPSARSRYEICKDKTSGKFNDKKFMKLANKREFHRLLRRPQFTDVFHHLFTRKFTQDQFTYEYTNEYRPLQFLAVDFNHTTAVPTLRFPVTEHVFVCVIKRFNVDIVPLYVSKEYNLSSDSYRAGRFLFLPPLLPRTINEYNVLLVEEPATVFRMFGHNVERMYLEIRKHHQSVPAEFSKDLDPICKLVATNIATNQQHRLCKEILQSTYFRKKVKFEIWQSRWECFEREKSFKTDEAREEGTGKTYHENMISCEGITKKSNRRIAYYVSRAYRSREVFVYSVDQSTGSDKVFLENLTINVNAVEEPLGFEDVE